MTYTYTPIYLYRFVHFIYGILKSESFHEQLDSTIYSSTLMIITPKRIKGPTELCERERLITLNQRGDGKQRVKVDHR